MLTPSLDRDEFPRERALDAIDLLLAIQNPDGGWPTYERIGGARWLELLNGLELFADNMLDSPYVELTSSVVQALARVRERLPQRDDAITRAIARGGRYLRNAQRDDGSWEGQWGICFTYGTWFGVWGLKGSGAARSRGEALAPHRPTKRSQSVSVRTRGSAPARARGRPSS